MHFIIFWLQKNIRRNKKNKYFLKDTIKRTTTNIRAMVKYYTLKPTRWEGVKAPKTISFASEDPTSITPTLDFIDSKVVVRPCKEKNGLAIMAYGMPGINVIRRDTKEKAFVPRSSITMVFPGDKVAIGETEYSFVLETMGAAKKKTAKRPTNYGGNDDDDEDDDDIWSSSSSFSSDDDDDDDDDKDDVTMDDTEGNDIKLSISKERLFENLVPLYPTLTRRELRIIALNTNSIRDATSTIFNPNFVRLYAGKTGNNANGEQQDQPLVAPSAPPPPEQMYMAGPPLSASAGGGLSMSGQMASAPPPQLAEEEIDPCVKRLIEEFPELTLEQANMAYEAADREEEVAKKFIIENFAAVKHGQGNDYRNDDENNNGGYGGGGRKGFMQRVGNFVANHIHRNHAPAPAPAPAQALPADPNDPVYQLREMFPNASLKVLRGTLVSRNNNVQQAVEVLLMMDPADLNDGEDAELPRPQAPPAGGAAGGGGDARANYAPTAPPPEKILTPLEQKAQERGMIVNVDMGRPWQSSNEMKGGYVEYIYKQVEFIRDNDEMQHTAVCLQTMIENEQRRYNDSYCFYHSYSVAHLDYELNALIATIVYDLDLTVYEDSRSYNLDFVFPPIPRVSFKPFTVIKSIEELSDFCTGYKNNNDPNYQAVGLSVSTSIFSTSSPAPPVALFRRGYSALSVNFDALMTGLLKECGFDSKMTNKIISVLKTTAAKYDMPVGCSGFGDTGSARATGHMLQIFINKEIVDQYAYPSQCLGYRDGKATMSEVLRSGKTNGQARIYISPDLFRSPEYSRPYYYCADLTFSMNRDRFVKDVKRQLSDLFLDEEVRKMIKYNIREKYNKQ